MLVNIFRTVKIDCSKESVIFIFALMCFCTIISGCSSYSLVAPTNWAFAGQLNSVPETQPHGELTTERNVSNIFIMIDGKAVFRDDPNIFRSTFRLSPGDHEMEAKCLFRQMTSSILPTTVKIEKGKAKTIHFVAESFSLKMYKERD